MSESNRVQLLLAAETAYGSAPASAAWDELRYTTESLSGTPQTVISEEVRSDRMIADQVKTGLQVGGGFNTELSATTFNALIQAAMCGTWATTSPTTINVAPSSATISESGKTLTAAGEDFVTDGFQVGRPVALTGFSNAGNNSTRVLAKVEATVLTFVSGAGLVDETAGGGVVDIDYTAPTTEEELKIGTTDRSFALQKGYLDVARYLLFTGMRVGSMSLNYQYGAILTGAFTFAGNGATPGTSDLRPGTPTTNAATTTRILNASSDVPGVYLDDEILAGVTIQNLQLELNNGLRAIEGIGYDAPVDQLKGTASVTGQVSMYMAANAWAYVEGILNQTPVAIGARVTDGSDGYEILLPKVKLSGEMPAGEGLDTDVMINASFTALYDATEDTSLKVTRFVA